MPKAHHLFLTVVAVLLAMLTVILFEVAPHIADFKLRNFAGLAFIASSYSFVGVSAYMLWAIYIQSRKA